MSIVLDINILCNRVLDTHIIEVLLNDYGVVIKSVDSIDNWMWDNEQKIEGLGQVGKIADRNRIVVIRMKQPLVKDLGIYIEKINNFYLYDLWINMSGYDVMDCDVITSGNKRFYEEIYKAVLKIDKRDTNNLKIVGIGLETDFYYSENVADIIQNSRNMVSWLIKDGIRDNSVENNYSMKKTEGAGMMILEKFK